MKVQACAHKSALCYFLLHLYIILGSSGLNMSHISV